MAAAIPNDSFEALFAPLPPAVDPLEAMVPPPPVDVPTVEDALTLLVEMQAVQLAGLEAAIRDMRQTHLRVLAMMAKVQEAKSS
ncbi:MAG: hypothetical protein GX649_20085 [Chloroflexi bacterium]|nr:hypothetical protein [Chloroflexota bacterium]